MAERTVPMAPVHLEMWHAEQATTSARENVYGAFRLHGHLGVDALNQALTAVAARHEQLRTRVIADQEPIQIISDSLSIGTEPIEAASEDEAVDLIRDDTDIRVRWDVLPLWRISRGTGRDRLDYAKLQIRSAGISCMTRTCPRRRAPMRSGPV